MKGVETEATKGQGQPEPGTRARAKLKGTVEVEVTVAFIVESIFSLHLYILYMYNIRCV